MTTLEQLNSVYHYLRRSTEPWRLESLSKGKNRCIITGRTSHLTVHHHDKNFKTIVYESFEATSLPFTDSVKDLTREELERLAAACLDLHWANGLGVVLYYAAHEALHVRYGPLVTKEQFKEYRLYRRRKAA